MARISKPPEERRQELLDVATRLFWSQGYAQTMVSDIVHEVGVAQGLFYYYFKSKEDIFIAAVDQLVQVWLEELALLLRDGARSPVARMRNALRAVTDFLRGIDLVQPRTQTGMTAEMHLRIHHHVMDLLEPFLTQVLEEGAEQGLLSAPFPGHMARFLLAGFVGVEFAPNAPQSDEMMRMVLQMAERLLCLPPDALRPQEEGAPPCPA